MSWCARNIRKLDKVDSTNDEALRWALEGADHGSLVISGEQTAGHGRGDRTWYSPAGNNIYMTLILRPEFSADKAGMLTLLMGLAVSRGTDRIIREITGGTLPETRIKWPNDVLLNGRKICGILTGMRLDPNGNSIVYIGVGLNVNGDAFPKDLQGKAMSIQGALKSLGLLSGELSEDHKDKLISLIMVEFEGLYDSFARENKLSFIKSEYNNRLINMNEMVKVLDPAGAYEGICSGITDHGELMVETGDYLRLVMSGEVSVRASDGSYI